MIIITLLKPFSTVVSGKMMRVIGKTTNGIHADIKEEKEVNILLNSHVKSVI